MQANFGKDGEITDTGKGAHPTTAEGLGGSNISGINDPKTKIDAAVTGHDAEESMKQDPITTGRAPVGFDAASNEVATLEDPGRGNTKNAAGNITTAGNPKTALPGQTGK